MKDNAALGPLQRAVGTWQVTGAHPFFPGRTLRGNARFERIEGGAFIRMQSQLADPEFPEGVAIFGTDGDRTDGNASECTMLYFDSRGVSRRYDVELRADGFTWSRDSPKFAQRFVVTIAADGRRMDSKGMMRRDGGEWEADLSLSYVRVDS